MQYTISHDTVFARALGVQGCRVQKFGRAEGVGGSAVDKGVVDIIYGEYCLQDST